MTPRAQTLLNCHIAGGFWLLAGARPVGSTGAFYKPVQHGNGASYNGTNTVSNVYAVTLPQLNRGLIDSGGSYWGYPSGEDTIPSTGKPNGFAGSLAQVKKEFLALVEYDKANGTDLAKGYSWSSSSNLFAFCGAPKVEDLVQPWTVTGASQVKRGSSGTYQTGTGSNSTVMKPGDIAYFRHTLTASAQMSSATNWSVRQQRLGAVSADSSTTAATGSWQKTTSGSGTNNVRDGGQRTIANTDLGGKVCEDVAWQPTSNSVTSQSRSAMACASIPYNYEMTTFVNMDGGVEPGASVTVTGGGTVKGRDKGNGLGNYSTQTKPLSLFTYTFVIPAGSNPAGDTFDIGSGDICTLMGGKMNIKSGSCGELSGSRKDNLTIDANGTGSVNSAQKTIPADSAAGDKFCSVVIGTLYLDDTATTNRRVSKPVCTTLGKKPKMQVWDGGIYAPGVRTSTSVLDGKLFGSWTQYEVVSGSSVSGDGSSSGLAGGFSGGSSGITGPWSRLTFANTPSLGNYAMLRSTSDLYRRLAAMVQTEATKTGTNVSELAGGLTLSVGQVKYYYSSGDVTIGGDIVAPSGGISSLYDVPQVIIVADNIRIAGNVQRVDAWLVAKNMVNTCAEISRAVNLRTNNCNNPLTINGPVIAKDLRAYRTAGADNLATADNPAEVFDLRVDAFLWIMALKKQSDASNSYIKTTYMRDAPVRY